jgi:hypothetical protein
MLDNQMKYFNEHDYAHAINISVELYRRFAALAEEETLLRLAAIYVVMNDEPEDRYLQSWFDKKREAWNDDAEAKDFFLTLAANVTGFYTNTSPESILKYLEENQKELLKALKYLGKRQSKNTSHI